MSKRKWESSEPSSNSPSKRRAIAIQIVTGSYEGVLHSFFAEIDSPTTESSDGNGERTTIFTNNFLQATHASAIRCLALSLSFTQSAQDPSSSTYSNILLAVGGTDSRIRTFKLSTDIKAVQAAKRKSKRPSDPVFNEELISLLHHDSTITSLRFPSRSKLLSSSLDSTIAVSRMRGGLVLSRIKAPIPKPVGRPSGDTAGPGEVPAGVNEVAVHPSNKLCISIGVGEKCMRLWNLVTGKRAGVLAFDKETLATAGEIRLKGGEGRRVIWNEAGDEFAVAFERAVVVYTIDCQVKSISKVGSTKVCQIKYLPAAMGTKRATDSDDQKIPKNILLISTEDGRVLFYDTNAKKHVENAEPGQMNGNNEVAGSGLPENTLIAQIGTAARGNRVKDFEVIPIVFATNNETAVNGDDDENDRGEDLKKYSSYVIVTGSSDGSVRIWHVDLEGLNKFGNTGESLNQPHSKKVKQDQADVPTANAQGNDTEQVGTLLGTSETGKRITCLGAFQMHRASAAATANGADDGDGDSGDDSDSDEENEEAWDGFDEGDEGVGEEDVSDSA